MTDTIRVAVVHAGAGPTVDGVADYVDHLVDVLPSVGVLALPVALRSLAGVRRRVRELDPDLVHLQFAPAATGPATLLPLACGSTPAPP